jgi:uncharacterized lipoprotein YddW (UPF0748 family)
MNLPLWRTIWAQGFRSRAWCSGLLLALLFSGSLLLNLALGWGGAAHPEIATAQTPADAREIRGVWLTNNDSPVWYDRTRLQDALDKLAQIKLNRIYPVVWNDGYALYPSPTAKREGIQPDVVVGRQGQDPLADLISQAHQRGMLVMPWFEFGFMAPPSSELATQHPQWLTQTRTGKKTSLSAAGEVVWLNPIHPEVQKFITDLVLDVVNQYDIDGIQFDDHTSLPSQFGYDPYTIRLYQKETKKLPHPDFQNPEWTRWRANKITAFMAQLNRAIKARKPQAMVSVSPAPYDFAYRFALQDWVGWVRQNLVDELIVQIYRYDLQSFVNQISRPEMVEARQKIPTGVGVLTGLRTRAVPISLIQAKVQASRQAGLGVCFFYYETLWNLAQESAAERLAGLRGLFP